MFYIDKFFSYNIFSIVPPFSDDLLTLVSFQPMGSNSGLGGPTNLRQSRGEFQLVDIACSAGLKLRQADEMSQLPRS
jgi:hypothetical protein